MNADLYLGYKQELGVNYKEVFTVLTRHDTIRMVSALVAQESWPIYQLDVKPAFLYGDLQKQQLRSEWWYYDQVTEVVFVFEAEEIAWALCSWLN